MKALSGEDAVARFLAEEQLGKMGDRALSALGPLVMSRGFAPARRHAIHVVAQIRSGKATRLLLRILEREQDVKVRGLVCKHVGRIGVEEAVPIIAKWLFTIRGRSFGRWRNPASTSRTYAWVYHAHALREIGSEKGIAILEKMLTAKHGGNGGQSLMRAYRQSLKELRTETAFRKGVRRVPGLDRQVDELFEFFRRDDLALIRLYRDKVVRLGPEGRRVLEGMKSHTDAKLRRAAAGLLANYSRLRRTR